MTEQITPVKRGSAKDVHELRLPLSHLFDQAFIGGKTNKVENIFLFTKVNQGGTVEPRISSEQNDAVWPACSDRVSHLAEHANQSLAPVFSSVKDSDGKTINKRQQGKVTIAVVVPVELSAFLCSVSRHGGVVDVDGDVAMLMSGIPKIGFEQKLIASIDRFLCDRLLESTEGRRTGKLIFPDCAHEAGIIFQFGCVVKVFASHKQ